MQRIHRWLGCSVFALMLTACFSQKPPVSTPMDFQWHYTHFVEELLAEGGRVIDYSSPASISTSEGQAYGMWFALLANDPERFQRMLSWANANLAAGGLGDRLPSWLWGQSEPDAAGETQWHVLDENAATDADVWMAYSLLLAAQRWQKPHFAALGKRLSARILEQSSVVVAGQRVLLPGPQGFTHEGYIVVNPSYFSFTLFRGLAELTGDERWQQVYASSVEILQQVARLPGASIPDWLALDMNLQIASPELLQERHQQLTAAGDYDAIRAYLWLSWEKQWYSATPPLEAFLGPYHFAARHNYPAVEMNPLTGAGSGRGGVGFTAILLPYLQQLSQPQAPLQARLFEDFKQRLLAFEPEEYKGNYYDTMLLMFATSTLGCLAFTQEGVLDLQHKELRDCAI
ncbi:hypothetical protein CWE15_03650 [Aliidiomarina taiwanensis]|uniref:Glucanase n=1 Tax=Aliidiomarina taiwanensis TaxID=946228 RepID=A0A432XA38_9GAMM|nr:glycosyl hydrolase family 8 [Aliidiomarina taiwanensis]RUO44275.1 hypothetical protein CWE15_03650 [Aliidiomarina taiwanensis]